MDVRASDIAALESRVQKQNYNKYLLQLRMNNVRSFINQEIRFEFPVTALIGTNGGGKSTILGAAAIAYKDIKPGTFFPKSNVSDNSMQDWRIDYDIIDREKSKPDPVQRNARFVSAKWRREDLLEREVLIFPIQRTVPAIEQGKFKRFIGITPIKKYTKEPIDKDVDKYVSRILGRDASQYEKIRIEGESASIFAGQRNKNDYSQFHFGAGEASIIEMVSKIEESDDYSLILDRKSVV
jgi:predicted ATP-dependent endonuclease of OLD family